MKHLLLKDKRRRVLFAFFEKRRLFYKALFHDTSLPKNFKRGLYIKFLELPRDSSISRIRNRCVLTNRPRAVYRKLGLSRLMFRKYL